MNKLILTLILLLTVLTSINSQTLIEKDLLVEKQKNEKSYVLMDSFDPKKVAKAGEFLKKSADYQYTSALCAVLSGGVIVGSTFMDKNSDKYVVMTVGCIGGIASIFFFAKSIEYKFKAGSQLELSVDRFILKF